MALHAFEDVEVARLVVCLGRDGTGRVGVPNDDVGVRSYSDATLERDKRGMITTGEQTLRLEGNV